MVAQILVSTLFPLLFLVQLEFQQGLNLDYHDQGWSSMLNHDDLAIVKVITIAWHPGCYTEYARYSLLLYFPPLCFAWSAAAVDVGAQEQDYPTRAYYDVEFPADQE